MAFGAMIVGRTRFTQNDLKELFLLLHPVGGPPYVSEDPTSPAELYGGTWERIEGRFIMGASDTYPAGSTGGEATHTLTVGELPEHAHYLRIGNKSGVNKTRFIPYDESSSVSYWEEKMKATQTATTGEGQPHNNIPPYYSMYIWRRVA